VKWPGGKWGVLEGRLLREIRDRKQVSEVARLVELRIDR
jgi:hypothetical protein